jgi:hypothetical protein
LDFLRWKLAAKEFLIERISAFGREFVGAAKSS